MIMINIDTLAEYLADNYDWDMELTELGVHIYKEDVTIDELLSLCKEISNICIVDYNSDFILIGLSEL